MRYSTYGSVRLVLAGCAALQLACGSNSPASPSSGTDAGAVRGAAGGNAGAQNVAPNLVLKTTPAMVGNTISGRIPLHVEFNLCQSGDADTGDSLNWQFNFGDSGKPAFNPNGTFNPDAEHTCRVTHSYDREGTFTATVSVTDKHLEDQGRDVVPMARKSQTVTIQANKPDASGCSALGVSTNFDGFALGTGGGALGIPGVTFSGGSIANTPTLTTLSVFLVSGPPVTITWASDQSAASFRFATNPGSSLTVQGFSGTGALLFTAPFTGVVQASGFPEGTAGGNAIFRSITLSAAPTTGFAIDNLTSTPACQ